jgi:hypothetical protein
VTDEPATEAEKRLAAKLVELERWQRSLNRQQKKSVQSVARMERAAAKLADRCRVLLDDVETLRADVRKAIRRD